MANPILLSAGIVILLAAVIVLYYIYKSLTSKSLLPARGKTSKLLHRADSPGSYWAGIIFYGIIFFITIMIGGNLVKIGSHGNQYPELHVPVSGYFSITTIIVAIIFFVMSVLFLSSVYWNYKRGYFVLRRGVWFKIYREHDPVLYWFFMGVFFAVGIILLTLGLRVIGIV